MTESEIDRAPSRFASAFSLVTGVVAAVPGIYSSMALALGSIGLALLLGGLVRGTRWLVTVGATALALGTLAAGAFGAPVAVLLLGAVAAVLAWDAGTYAIGVGEQLGRGAATSVPIEATHVAASTIVGLTTAGIGYAVFAIGVGGSPVLTLVTLLVAVVLLASGLR